MCSSDLYAQDLGFGEEVDQAALAERKPDFLFAFTPLIIREPLLSAPSIAAINFHTAPPKWPGRGSCSFALFESDTAFGVTAHFMTEQIDAGSILLSQRFPIDPDETVASLHKKTLEEIPILVANVLQNIQDHEGKPVPSGEQWQRRALTKKDFYNAMRIPDDASDDEIRR